MRLTLSKALGRNAETALMYTSFIFFIAQCFLFYNAFIYKIPKFLKIVD